MPTYEEKLEELKRQTEADSARFTALVLLFGFMAAHFLL